MYGMILSISVFTLLACLVIRAAARYLIQKADEEARALKDSAEKLVKKKNTLNAKEEKVEDQAAEIFTLYDMTREVAKNFSEEDAFKKFRAKLIEAISCESCILLDPEDEKLKEFKAKKDHFIFTLRSRKKLLGYLAMKGVRDEDKEKVIILSTQFALVLRRIRLYQEVQRLAITDSLTGVHTRRHILGRLEEEVNRAKARKIPLAFLMIDVDFFKNFNDQYGHLTGDLILREISGIVKDNIREIDIIGRYGGEEFCVILPDTEQGGARYVAGRIRSAVESTPIKAYDSIVRTTVSIGISIFPQDAKTLSELIDKADWAMYRAKKIGRNAICSFGLYEG